MQTFPIPNPFPKEFPMRKYMIAVLVVFLGGCAGEYVRTEVTTITEKDGKQSSVEKKVTESGFRSAPPVQPFFFGGASYNPYYSSYRQVRYFDGTGFFYHQPQFWGATYQTGSCLNPSWYIYDQ